MFNTLTWSFTLFPDLHLVLFLCVDGQKVGRGLNIIGQFCLCKLRPERLESLCCFLHHQSKTFNGLQAQDKPMLDLATSVQYNTSHTTERYPNTIHTNGWVCNKEKTSTCTTNKCTVLKHSSHRSMGMCWKSITDYLKASPQMEWEERQFICWRWRPTSSWRTRFF